MATTAVALASMNTSPPLPGLGGLATCASCHTADLTTADAVAAGAHWQCRRCGQPWDAVRLATVAAYTAWLSARTAPAVSR